MPKLAIAIAMLSSSSRTHTSIHPHALLPGLPNCVVLDCILPRIPWYTRPLLKSLSSSWLHALLLPHSYSSLTRYIAPEEGLILAHQLPEKASTDCLGLVRHLPQPHALSIFNERTGKWRQLPPIPALRPLKVLHDCGVACVFGKLFVMGGWDPRSDAVSADVYMLDLGGGLWNWEKRQSMHTAKAFFHCKSVAGKIYVVGGSSSQNGLEEEPFPEIYDVESDRWDLLPRINLSRSFHYNGLAVANKQVLAYGFCAAERGELVRFWRVYDPLTSKWADWDCDLASCSRVVAGDHDLRDGVINRFDIRSKKWLPFAGKVCGKAWRWEAGKKVLCDSTCAHGFFVVTECSKPHVYATICEGENRCLSIWRGDLDYPYMTVSWQKIELPGNISMCSEMCYLRD